MHQQRTPTHNIVVMGKQGVLRRIPRTQCTVFASIIIVVVVVVAENFNNPQSHCCLSGPDTSLVLAPGLLPSALAGTVSVVVICLLGQRPVHSYSSPRSTWN